MGMIGSAHSHWLVSSLHFVYRNRYLIKISLLVWTISSFAHQNSSYNKMKAKYKIWSADQILNLATEKSEEKVRRLLNY